jgi:hypothetical protein
MLCLVPIMAQFSLTAQAASPPVPDGQSATTEKTITIGAEPSEAFRAFVAAPAILGAKDGRLLVDRGSEKRLYRIGDVFDAKLGIKLYSISFESGGAIVVFQEKTGALLDKKVGQK